MSATRLTSPGTLTSSRHTCDVHRVNELTLHPAASPASFHHFTNCSCGSCHAVRENVAWLLWCRGLPKSKRKRLFHRLALRLSRAKDSQLPPRRYKDNPEALKNMQDVQFFNNFKEIVLTAERSLLYALGFQRDIGHPYYWSTTILRRLGSLPGDGQQSGDGPWWQTYDQKTVSSTVCRMLDDSSTPTTDSMHGTGSEPN